MPLVVGRSHRLVKAIIGVSTKVRAAANLFIGALSGIGGGLLGTDARVENALKGGERREEEPGHLK